MNLTELILGILILLAGLLSAAWILAGRRPTSVSDPRETVRLPGFKDHTVDLNARIRGVEPDTGVIAYHRHRMPTYEALREAGELHEPGARHLRER